MKKIFKIYDLRFKKWVKENHWEAVFLILTLLVAAFLRLYRIGDYMTFLGDEGRDAIIVRRLLVDFDPILIGPGTSIGNMYLGPLYYYLIAPSLFLANYSPIGPSVFIALLGVVTCAFVWMVAREWFGKLAAGIALIFYSVSPVVIVYSRSSWNPNIMPFFALLCIYSIWRVWQELEFKWLFIMCVSFAFVLQSHYLGLLLAPVMGLFWLLTLLKLKVKGQEVRRFVSKTLGGLGVFAFLMSPLVIFDARHGWINFSAIKVFFLERQTTVSARPWNAFPKLLPILQKITTRLIAGMDEIYGKWIAALFAGGVLWLISRFKEFGIKDKKNSAFLLLLSWLGISFIGLGLYKQEIYDHYYGIFFPAIFIFLGGIVQIFLEKRKFSLVHVILGVVLFVLLVVNFQNNPLKNPPNYQMRRAQVVAEKISQESNGKKFNLAVVAERNYEDGYQYFLEKESDLVYDINPLKLDETLANILFVVCELPEEKCDPTHNPKAEIANFGWSKIEGEWNIAGVIVYKLAHVQ